MYIIGRNYTTNNTDTELLSNLGNYLTNTWLAMLHEELYTDIS